MFLPLLSLGLLLLVPGTFLLFAFFLRGLAHRTFPRVDLNQGNPKLFVPSILFHSFFEPVWTKNVLSTAILQRFEVGQLRPVFFHLIAAPAGILMTLGFPLIGSLINGVWLLSLTFLFLVLSHFWRRLWHWSVVLFAVSLVLVAFEFTLRNASILRSIFFDSEIVWVLTDGRWVSCGLIFTMAAAVTLLLRIPYFIFWTALLLQQLQILSINVLIFAVAGELVAMILILFLATRGLGGTLRQFWREWFAVSVSGLLGGLCLSLFLRWWGFGMVTSFEGGGGYSLDIFILLASFPVGILLAGALWGHLSYPRFHKDFRSSGVVPLESWNRLLLPGLWAWWAPLLDERAQLLEKASREIQDLNPDKIPLAFRERVSGGLKDLKLQTENLRSFLHE